MTSDEKKELRQELISMFSKLPVTVADTAELIRETAQDAGFSPYQAVSPVFNFVSRMPLATYLQHQESISEVLHRATEEIRLLTGLSAGEG